MKISNKIKALVATLAVAVMGISALPVSAAQVLCPNGTKAPSNDLTRCTDISNTDNGNNNNDLMKTLNTIINVVIGVIGFVAVVIIIVGGVQYTLSAGDAAKVTKAKNTIMYGIIGLVIAMLAFAIVNFILTNVFGGQS